MTWIRFEATGEPAPSLHLPSLNGPALTVSDLRGRHNGLLLFAHGPECAACANTINILAAQEEAIRDNEAKVLIVLPTQTVTVPPQWAGLYVLADPAGALRRQYEALIEFETPHEVMLFVLNRHTVPHTAWVGTEAPTALATDALDWLEILLYKCAECGGKTGWPGHSVWEEVDLPEWDD